MTDSIWRERAQNVLVKPQPPFHPKGASQHNGTPWYFKNGRGAHLYDEAGAEYLDLTMARGAVILGYGHPVTSEALRSHADCGIQTSLRHHAEIEVAEKIVELVPCAEQVVFGKNGSDVCTAAIRLSRAATGRNVVLSSGYHGFQDWFAATMPNVAGFPASYSDDLFTFDLNDLDGFKRLVSEHSHDLAAIIIEPAHVILPAPGFLEAVREAADSSGAILIFDEVVTGFRVHLGGWQGISGVTPDLVCLGKAMTNGYPLSALAGNRRIMGELKKTFFSMTYQADSLGFVLARSCLRYLHTNDVPSLLTAKGEMLREGFNRAARHHRLPASAIGIAPRLELTFSPHEDLGKEEQEEIFLSTLSRRNIIPTLTVSPCEQLTDSDIERACDAFMLGMAEIQSALERRA